MTTPQSPTYPTGEAAPHGEVCGTCGGTGRKRTATHIFRCPDCNGAGRAPASPAVEPMEVFDAQGRSIGIRGEQSACGFHEKAAVEPTGSADGSLSIDEAIAGVVDLFPGADRQALRCLARLLCKPPTGSANEAVERVARAIALADDEDYMEDRQRYDKRARAAIASVPAPAAGAVERAILAEWTQSLETARIILCADLVERGDKLSLDAENALTLMGDIISRALTRQGDATSAEGAGT